MAGAGSRAWAKRLSAGKNIVISLIYRDIGFRVNYSLVPPAAPSPSGWPATAGLLGRRSSLSVGASGTGQVVRRRFE